jgi:hypothetical protein
MLKMKLSIAIALVAVLLLPLAAYAAGEGSAQGSFGALGGKPEVESIEIYLASDNSSVSGMTPLVEYYVKLNITETSQLKHLQQVTATIYFDPTADHSGPLGADPQTCAILTWDATTGWSISPSSATTWQLIPASCSHPDLSGNATNGDWIFYFIPGEVATKTYPAGTPRWDAEGIATNKSSQDSDPLYLTLEKTMDCYVEISVSGGVNWGDVPLGLKFADAPNPMPPSDNITITYISNGNYYSNVKSSSTWDNGSESVTLSTGDPPSNPSEFALKAYSSNNLVAADNVTAAYTHMDTGTITPDVDGTEIKSNRLWLALSASGILPGLYNGTIWYEIECH